MTDNSPLSCIRRGTEHDLYDAMSLARDFLSRSHMKLDGPTSVFSRSLFVAIALTISYLRGKGSYEEVVNYLVDPVWDTPKQLLLSFQCDTDSFQQKEAKVWLSQLLTQIKHLSPGQSAVLVERCHAHWMSALNPTSNSHRRSMKPRSAIQVFDPGAVSNALTLVGELKDEKKITGDRILEQAQLNSGYRIVPNAKKTVTTLEGIKRKFENLEEPISRLQSGLVLAGCMKPENFHIAPVLLWGEPGIGKTFLATQLASSLGVSMEKISAGGVQGGFQFTGSHSSWMSAKPGALVSLLASGKFASPVVVIDEVDKIRDANYPALPVLLDLLEPDTAKRFKDEFFEMAFDASKVIYVLTANSLKGVPESLLSRCEIFRVARPEPAQRTRIIEGLADELCKKTRRKIRLHAGSIKVLAERVDIDLRKVTFLVQDAFAKSIRSGEAVAYLWIPARGDRNSASDPPEEKR